MLNRFGMSKQDEAMGEREAMDGESPRRAGLRSQAEQRLHTGTTEHDLAASEADARAIVHELQVHQIELEMQNEELQRAQAEAREASERYCDLFDFAPVGYFVWDQEGRILEVNLAGAALLRRDRGAVIHRRFGQFVATEHHARFADFCAGAGDRQQADLRGQARRRRAGAPGTPGRGRAGRGHCRPRPPGGHPVPWVGEALPFGRHRHQPAEGAPTSWRQPTRPCNPRSPRTVAEEEIRSLAEFPQENPNPILRASGDGRVLYANQPAVRTPGNDGLARRAKPCPSSCSSRLERILEEGETREFDLLCPAGHTFAFAVAASSRAGQMNLYAP